jgi:formate hydrogenlyase transcriptional activator
MGLLKMAVLMNGPGGFIVAVAGEHVGKTRMDITQPGESKGSIPVVGDEMPAGKQGLTGTNEKAFGLEEGLQGRLEFEMLLADLSARFVNLPSDRIDTEIEEAERRICKSLGLDTAALWQWEEDASGSFTLTHFFDTRGGAMPPERKIDSFYPWCREQMLLGRVVALSSLEELPADAARDRESGRLLGIKSSLLLPLSVGSGRTIGILVLNTTVTERKWPNTLVKRLQLVAQVFANALARKLADRERQQMETQLRDQLKEIEELKQQLESENFYLQKEIGLLVEQTEIVGESAAIKNALVQAGQVAGTDSNVLLLGETGTGKELLARAIHSMSRRKARALVTVNCASLPPTLIESELFGREKGAYTDALTRMAGRFEIADGSTLFLDEIGELPFEVQSKLLRVLEEGRFERLGSTKTLTADVRIIAATNRDLARAVKEGRFRQDLYYRLAVFPIVTPPLRERRVDIPLLVWTFVKEYEKKIGKRIDRIDRNSMESMQHYPWPGNIRELRNVIEHGMIVSTGNILAVRLPHFDLSEEAKGSDLAAIERSHILRVLTASHWRISGIGGAAEALGLKRTTLQSLMKRLGIRRPRPEMPK